jgi:hypothetical protein
MARDGSGARIVDWQPPEPFATTWQLSGDEEATDVSGSRSDPDAGGPEHPLAPRHDRTRMSLSAYRPRIEDRQALEDHLRHEVIEMRARGYITDRPVPICTTEAGEYLVVLEWSSTTAVDDAHADPEIMAIWERKARLFEYIGVSELVRSDVPFASYDLVMDV